MSPGLCRRKISVDHGRANERTGRGPETGEDGARRQRGAVAGGGRDPEPPLAVAGEPGRGSAGGGPAGKGPARGEPALRRGPGSAGQQEGVFLRHRQLSVQALHQDPRPDAGVYPPVFQGALAPERRGRARAAHEVLQGVRAGDRGAGAAAQDRRPGVQQGGGRRASSGQDPAAEPEAARDAAADQAGGQGRPAVAVHERVQEPRAARGEATGYRRSV
ncbi:hypothetical protein KL924_005323 [Ogataea haglerorum]|nr:hypothetical protein KL924_005323 [Ogataea haglerorum]